MHSFATRAPVQTGWLSCCLFLLVTTLHSACSEPEVPDVQLTFRRSGQELRRLSLRELAAHAPARIVESDDVFYGKRKHFRAIPVEAALAFAFGASEATLRKASFILQAADGYAVPVQGSRLFEGGAFLAFDDRDVPGFAPIGPQHVSPAPAYLVWTRDGQNDPVSHPRPWQITVIELAQVEQLYPHAVPTGEAADSQAMQGFAVFRSHCIKCHAINREGGHVGPDLNVPQSIVDYRPEAQIRAYIRDPASFRYGLMPAHPDLTEADLDSLIVYFGAMSRRKHDPAGKPKPPAPTP